MAGPLDPRESWVADRCPMARTLEVVSTKSAFLILREAFYGTTRFDDFAKRAQVSDPVAAARLSELVEEGLLEREPYQEPGQRTRHAYRLTEKGSDYCRCSWRRCSGGVSGWTSGAGSWSYSMPAVVVGRCGPNFAAPRLTTFPLMNSSCGRTKTIAEPTLPSARLGIAGR